MKRVYICFTAILTAVSITTRAQQGNVDTHIAVTDQQDENTYAVIISNEHYQFEEPVPFACNDGAIFKLYCEKTLGIPEKNIKFVEDATLNVMKFNLQWLERIMKVKNGQARAFVYYSGHGMPDEDSKKAYLLPVDGFSTEPSTGYSTEDLYKLLGGMPSKGTVVLLDACFSGSKREGGMMKSSRGVAIKAKSEPLQGNMVVFSAAQGNETAYPLKSKEHGMFTYFLLQQLHDKKGFVTLGELSDYVTKMVAETSIKENDKSQTPSVAAAANAEGWRNWKMANQEAGKYVNMPKTLGKKQGSSTTAEQPSEPTKSEGLDLSAGGAFSLAGVVYEMVRIDRGSFVMGTKEMPNSFSTFSMNQPAHRVSLNAYAIGKTEVTQELWQAVMGSNPSANKNPKQAVENVSWDDCQQFLKKLNALCGTNFRLPTEAEWEYAAQSASTYTSLGLKDMTAGVDEWCQDFYGRYTQMNQNNPKGPGMGFQRVVRGASNGNVAKARRASQRGHMRPTDVSSTVGLRLAHDVK